MTGSLAKSRADPVSHRVGSVVHPEFTLLVGFAVAAFMRAKAAKSVSWLRFSPSARRLTALRLMKSMLSVTGC